MGVTVDWAKIQKILVISLSNVGDAILTTPVISLLRERFPSSDLSVLVGPKGVPLFSNSHTVSEVILFDKAASWLKKLTLVFELRKRKFDLVVDLRNTAIPILIRPRYRTSFFLDRSSLSMRARHLDQLRSLFPVDHCENRFHFFNEEERESALRKLAHHLSGSGADRLVVIAPGAGSALKRWTISGFAQLADHLIERGRTVALVGEGGEIDLGLALEQKISKPLANLIGLLTLRELAALVNQASLIVANDSAVMHLAHELHRPTLSIFGPTDENKYGQTGPERRTVRLNLDCTPCEQAECRLEHRVCLDDLSARPVIQACEELLNHAPR